MGGGGFTQGLTELPKDSSDHITLIHITLPLPHNPHPINKIKRVDQRNAPIMHLFEHGEEEGPIRLEGQKWDWNSQ